MAARFWVGGTGTWDATTTANWSATSGGAGGASVPGAADDVTINTASITVTTNYNVSVISVTINASAATLSLGGTLTCSGAITLTAGTFTTNNFNVTASQIVSTSGTRTLNLGSSTITLSGTVAFNLVGTLTGLTINAGTSTINATASGAQISTGGTITPTFTFYNLNFTSTVVGTRIISGGFTFNNISVAGPASAGVVGVTLTGITINGTLSTTGTAGNRRVWFQGITYGIAQTLTINSAPSLTDADFRDIYVTGTAAPISGTRIGDLRGIRGITASTPKTVYWNLAGAQNWSANGWATTSTGTPSTDNFPLAQDTATFTDAGSVTGTITMNAAISYTGTVDMSGRTSAMTLATTAFTIYGNWINGSGTTLSGTAALTYSGRNTQTITSASKTFTQPFTIDSYGGSVELADALNIGSNRLTVTNGTFDTKNFNFTAGDISSSNVTVRTIKLGSSTVTLSALGAVTFSISTNLTLNAGTSSIVLSSSNPTILGGTTGVVFYNVTSTSTSVGTALSIQGENTFNNLSISSPSSAGLSFLRLNAKQTINGTLTVAGASAVRRVFVQSSDSSNNPVVGTTRTLTVNTISAADCDFRDITIAGAAAGSSPTRAGDCGGNTGITFPSPKTVYWNLSGAQNWSATAWAPGTGGTPDINNFPLAQDTAVFDEAGSVTGTITINAGWNIGTFNASARTSAMTLTTSTNAPFVHGNWLFGTGVTSSSTTGTITFSGRGTSTITSNGVTFNCPITVACVTGTVQLADALSLGATRTLTHTSGTFDAVSYNVTVGLYSAVSAIASSVIKMGSGTWTLSGTGTVWAFSSAVAFYKGTANIVLSDTSTTARTFAGGVISYNKLTIGGATGISTTTITGNNQFTELASTKTVAHTIALGTTTQNFGAWTVTGTVGNVVTVTGTGTEHQLVGACTDGIDYLAMGSIGFAATSPAEFYAGANSTGTAAAPVYRTAKPADSTRYWVGGTGNWNDTARWSTSSGGLGGADLPRSHDDVVFDSLSNATAYTATVNAITGGNRCKALTIAGPLVGNVTLGGSTTLFIHDDITLPATGMTRAYSGIITLSGTGAGKTITTNGLTLNSNTVVNGVGAEWALADALNIGTSILTITNGAFDTANYNLTGGAVNSFSGNTCVLDFGSSTVSMSSTFTFGTTEVFRANLTFNAGTSQINLSSPTQSLQGNNQTFYDVSFTNTSISTATINGANTFNNLSFVGRTSANVANVSLTDNQTITGTLTLSAGTNATMRHFLQSNTIGTTRTLTCAAFSGTDVDFRDITIAGAAAPVSGTRLGDCKGNSGITFGAGVPKYWNLAAGGNWSAIGWATGSGGTPAVNNFPLAQDTCIFEATGLNSGATVTINAGYSIGTINMSARTSNTMTLASGTNTLIIYGNWINGTGTTLTGTGPLNFAGRGSQTITSAGKTFTQPIYIASLSGTVTLQDALTSSSSSSQALSMYNGTFDAAVYNVTLTGANSAFNASQSTAARTVAIGSGTWAITGSGAGWESGTSTNLTVTGTGTVSLTSASAKSFAGGSISYSGITLDQGGAGALTITGNNTFKNITNSYSVTGATNITLGTTTQTVTQFTGTGTSGKVLTIQGTSASSPATLILTTGTVTASDYLSITGIRAYNLVDTWYAGANSTNNGSLGWIFAAGVIVASFGNMFLLF